MPNVLITGIQSYLAQLVAGALAGQPGVMVTGTASSLAGVAEPGVADLGVTLIETTLRGQALLDLFQRVQPDTLIHLDQPGEQVGGQRRAGQLQTIELLATAVARGVRTIILRSSTLV
ncbi:MAG TPA: NAD-dependent epimerase/dehydratase family protein, partial [Roseiflexaceae bacterium]|nr:NAD-dependent epimerase/dehydratase family protein [Roseiflexaceae bacterium]